VWRSLAVMGFLYSAGHPSLESVLPGNLTIALDTFHREVNQAVAKAYYTLSNTNLNIVENLELCATYVETRLTFDK
jgi:hypothetical protein